MYISEVLAPHMPVRAVTEQFPRPRQEVGQPNE